MWNDLDGPALDRYITGNYGNDQFDEVVYCQCCDAGPFKLWQVDEWEKCLECGGDFYA